MIRLLLIVCAAFSLGLPLRSARVTVTPREIDDLLSNPGMGWQTFHTFADRDKALAGLPSSSAYFRFYWREIEPREGQIDFAQLNGILENAHKSGQKLAFRVMCTGSEAPMDVPAWLKEKGARGYQFTYEKNGPRHWAPDWEDPLFQDAHFRLIRELGKRYDGLADLDLLDIGTVGLWGEWHMSGTTDVATGKEVPMPLPSTRIRIIEEWRKAFPKTAKVMLIGDVAGMRYAKAHGIGWRADCLGDLGGFSKTWNHMEHFYRQQLEKTSTLDAWKAGPVAFESCWDMRKWKQENWDIRLIFDYALKLHASYVNNKSAPLPDGARPEVERMLKRLGYRLVLRRFSHDSVVYRGWPIKVEMDWENIGVAPPYRNYRLALRLVQKEVGVILLKSLIKKWLPGKHRVEESPQIAQSLKPGSYEVSVGVIHPKTMEPEVRLAIAGRAGDGWYPLSKLQVK